jgi:hypothetical protein
VSVSALFSLANAAASPAQSGEKSPLPRFSAASRNGATAPAANGNGGASRQMGPASRRRRRTRMDPEYAHKRLIAALHGIAAGKEILDVVEVRPFGQQAHIGLAVADARSLSMQIILRPWGNRQPHL